MAIAGRPPKENAVTRHVRTHDWAEFVNVPFKGDVKLPPVVKKGWGWTNATREWWRRVSTMPHCAGWTESDWGFALDTARVHANFVETGKDAGELRMRERIMGTTADARAANRIRYVEPPSVPVDEANGDKEPVRLDDRRKRLGGEEDD